MDRNSLNSSPLKMLQITVISTHDWENTPMYKQFVLGETEEESLKDTDIMQTIIKELISEKMKVKMKGMFNLNKKKIKGKKGGIRSKSGSPTSDSDRSKSINDVRDNILGALGGVSFGIGAGLGKAFDADKHGDGMLTEAMNRVRTKMLEEQEIEYTLGVLKKSGNNVQKEDKKIYFQKAKITLEILMTKMGLHALYKSIIDQYENMFKSQDTEAFDETLIKLLYRCLMIKRSIQKTQKIFKLIEKRDSILKDFIDMVAKDEQQNGSELGSRQLVKQEKALTQVCQQSSRLYVQVVQFLDESNYFKGGKFIYKSQDLQKMLREDILKLRMEYQAKFINTIPIMDRHGTLQFNQDRSSSKADRVTLKARDDSGTHLEESSLQIYACQSEVYRDQRSSSTGFKGF